MVRWMLSNLINEKKSKYFKKIVEIDSLQNKYFIKQNIELKSIKSKINGKECIWILHGIFMVNINLI